MRDDRTIDRYGFLNSRVSTSDEKRLRQDNARIEKWTKMLGNWDHYVLSKQDKLKNRIRKGIPNCFRGRAWYLLSGAEAIKQNYPDNHYESLLALEAQRNVEIEITLDLDRTFPNHIKFREKEGKNSLFRVLKAYAIMDPEVSYTQGMSFIVALFLIFLSEEESFWLLVTLITQYDFKGFFIQGMSKAYECFHIADGLLKKFEPKIFKKFQSDGVSISMYAEQWFITGFLTDFSVESALKIWDCFFNEGFKIFYRVYLATLKINSKLLFKSSLEKSMKILKKVGYEINSEVLMSKAFGLSLSHKHIDRLDTEFRSTRGYCM